MRRTPSQIFFKYLASILRTPFSITSLNGCFQNTLPHMSNFSLGLLRPFAVSFCIYKTETTHSRDILLPNVMLWVLQFFQFYLILSIFTPPNPPKFFFYFYIFRNLTYILFWKFALCSFPISDWLKAPVPLHFEKKLYMINQKSRASPDFLKIIYD